MKNSMRQIGHMLNIDREHGGSQVLCAEKMGVSKQQIFKYLKQKMIVVDGKLYLFRRNISET